MKRKNRPGKRIQVCEMLESRRLLSTCVINGTNGTDIWHLEADAGTIFVNGVTTAVPGMTAVQVNGFDGDDFLNIGHTTIPIAFNGGNQNDDCILTSGFLSSQVLSTVTYVGGAGTDTAEARDDLATFNNTYTITGPQVGWTSGTLNFDSTLENVSMNTGKGSNAIYAQNPATLTGYTVNGNTGSDTMYLDVSNSGNGLTFYGGNGAGTDSIQVSDYNHNAATTYTITDLTISRSPFLINYRECESVQLQGTGTAAGIYNVQSSLTPLSLLGGTVNDTFNLKLCNASTFGINGAVSVYGFGGSDSLNFDGTLWTNSPLTFWLTSNSMSINSPTPVITYSAMASVTLSGPAQATTSNCSYVVTGTAASITNQTSILMGTGNNDIYVRPRDAAGNLTIATNLGISGGGGSDTMHVEDNNQPLPLTCKFYNPFGAGTEDIAGLGNGLVGASSDVEAIVVLAGDGDDTFNVESFKTGSQLRIYGGDGFDTVMLASTSWDLAASLTSISYFLFDGQGGETNYLDVMNINSTVPWTYACADSYVQTARNGGGYFAQWNYVNCGYIFCGGGSAADGYSVSSTPSNSNMDVNGGGGDDSYAIGLSGRTNLIRGQVTCGNFVNGNDTVTINNSADTTGRIVHVTPDFVGDSIGDTMFAPGGGVYIEDIRGTVTLRCGSGADTVYALPSQNTPIAIQGNSPSTSNGDTLNVAIAPLSNPVYHDLGGGSGNFTYTGTPGFTFTGIETVNSDAVRPTVLSQNFVATPAGQSIVVQFSEDVSRSLYPNFAQAVDQHDPFRWFDAETVTYDAATNTATFGFSALPEGSYSVYLRSNRIRDLYGNPMAGDPPTYNFTWSPGTDGPDQMRVVRDPNSGEFDIFFDGRTPDLVGVPETNKIVLGGGEGDDSLTVDLAGGNPVPAGGIVYDGGNGSDSLGVAGSGGSDAVSFNGNAVLINGSQVSDAGVESFGFNGAGAYSSVTVSTGQLMLSDTQRFDSLSVGDGATVEMQPDSNGLLIARNLSVAPTGLIDLADGDLILDPSSNRAARGGTAPGRGGDPLATIEGLIRSARNGGAWDGFGITSSSARDNPQQNSTLGALSGSQYHGVWGASATFDGETVSDAAVIVKYTYYGDTDFNGKVDGADYARIDAAFNQQLTQGNLGGWINGDSDFNGKIDGIDYALIDAAFNSQQAIL